MNSTEQKSFIESGYAHLHLPPVVSVGNWEGPHKWNSLEPLFILCVKGANFSVNDNYIRQ